MTDFDVCPECGSLVTSELVRNERRFYRCLKGCGWGSYTKPKKEQCNIGEIENNGQRN